jgi:hypothetical protein
MLIEHVLCPVPQVRGPSHNACGFHFSGFGALTWAGGFLKPSENLELLGNPRLARLRLRGTWGTKLYFLGRDSGGTRPARR